MIPRPTRVTRTSILLPYTPLFRARLRLLDAAPVQPASAVAHARTVQVAIYFITLLLKSSASLDVDAGRGVVAGGPRTIGVADFGIEPRLGAVAAGHAVARLVEQQPLQIVGVLERIGRQIDVVRRHRLDPLGSHDDDEFEIG